MKLCDEIIRDEGLTGGLGGFERVFPKTYPRKAGHTAGIFRTTVAFRPERQT